MAGCAKKIPLTFWAMMIGTLAITGVGIPLTHYGFAGFLSKDAVIESAWVGSSYAFWLLVVAACFTSFYSWRLMFMTFYGESRAAAHGHGDHGRSRPRDHEPHESPLVMLIPLGVLALGAVFSGMLWYNVFFGDEGKMRTWFGMEAVAEHVADGAEMTAEADHATEAAPRNRRTAEAAAPRPQRRSRGCRRPMRATPARQPGPRRKGAIFMGADNHVIHAAHEAPKWVKVSPFVAMLIGFGAGLAVLHPPPRPAGPSGRAAAPALPVPLNKWYFDELYDWIFVRPAKWLGSFLWKKGDGRGHRRHAQRGGDGDHPLLHPPRGPRAIGLSLPLRLRDGAGDRGPCHLDGAFGRRQVRAEDIMAQQLLSIITFLPLVAAVILALFMRGDDEAAQMGAKRLALFTTAATFVVSLFLLLGVRSRRTPAFSSWSSGPGSWA